MHPPPCCSFALALTAFIVTHAAAAETQTPPRPYEIAFTSFSPLNAEIFLAEADGANPRPFLPHAGFDGNASFSSDGGWIVFASEREGSFDIFRAHPDGTHLERLIDDPAYDDQAALSPDGKLLAFVSSRSGQADIWILDLATRALRNLSNHPGGDFRPAWSPDGQWIAFSSDRDSTRPKDRQGFGIILSTALFLVRPDGADLRRVSRADAQVGSPAWSGDGRQIAYHVAELSEVNTITRVMRQRGTTQIAILDVDSGESRLLTSGPGEKWSPQWRAAQSVAYVSGGPDGGIETTGAGALGRGSFQSPKWSTDGRRVVFHRDVDDHWPPHQRWWSREPEFALVRAGVFPAYAKQGDAMLSNDRSAAALHNSILRMDRDGSNPSVLFHDAEKSALGPVFSPDGQHVAFALGQFFQSVRGPALADIAVMRRDGTGLRVLTDGTANHAFPSWSPDGREIVYRASGAGNRGLFIVDVETRATRALTPGSGWDNFPAWSPKGDRIAFTRYHEGNYDIYTVKPDGTDVRRLTDAPGNDAHCAWSPDGAWLAFASSRGGFKDESVLHPCNPQPYGEIWVMRADGSDQRALTDNPFEEGTVAWAPR